jgi:protein O-mannosyl-transferase
MSVLSVTEGVLAMKRAGLQPGDFHCTAFGGMPPNSTILGKTSELFSSPRIRAWAFALLLAGVTIFAYRPAWHGGFVWDDDDYIIKNDLLTASDGLWRIWFSLDSPSQYFPLVYTTFRIERALWGLNPTGYHWVNLLLHVANALLVWRLLARLNVPGAWLAGAIFALHPVQVESVAWITERKNVLMGFFFLLTLLAWTNFIDPRTKHPWRFYGLAVVLYVLALSAKSTACTLPAALFLILWLQKKPITKQRLIQIVPFVILGIGMGLLAIWWERYHQGTNRTAFPFLNPIERVLVASRAVWFYLSKLIWPANLTFIYPRWNISPAHLLPYLWLLAAIVACAIIYFVRRYVGRSLEVAAAFFVITLSPVLGFIMLFTFRYTFVADHYQYLACIGPIALFSAGVVGLADLFHQHRAIILGTAAVGALGLGVLTWRQSAMYGDIETLWWTTLKRNPECWMAHTNLGLVLLQKGQLDDGIAHYRAALQMQPSSWDAEYNLGTALVGRGEVDEAISHCERAVAMQPNDPDAQVSLGDALREKKRLEEAIARYQRAMALRPDYFLARYGLARAFLEKGELDTAIQHCRAALFIRPDDPDAHTILAVGLDGKGETAQAIHHYEKAVGISPKSIPALTNLAWLLATSSNEALRDGNKAVKLAGEANQLLGGTNPVVLRTLAAAYAEMGQFQKAIESAQAAMQLARLSGDNSLAAEIGDQLGFYRLRVPYRETRR